MSAGLIYGLSALFGYFVGSIPFGLILTRRYTQNRFRKYRGNECAADGE